MEDLITKIALDYVKKASFEGAPLPELIKLSKMLAKSVPSMDPKTVAYGTYATYRFMANHEPWVKDLHKAFLKQYRLNFIEWMRFALVKRANVGGGGSGIKKVQNGLADFVESIPAILEGKSSPNMSKYLPKTEYFIPKVMDPLGKKITSVVRKDADKAGLVDQGKPFQLQWDSQAKVLYLPYSRETLKNTNQFLSDGFQKDYKNHRWVYPGKAIPKRLEKWFGLPARNGDISEWYFDTWLPQNIDRFTKVFSDFARNKQSSYRLNFTQQGEKVSVKFLRKIDTASAAIEELRYRYTNRSGRGEWLKAMDLYIDLVRHKSSNMGLMLILDRLNNLQHSNGLFMDHFPVAIKRWYLSFLNAKMNAPQGELVKFIPDRDVKNLLAELNHYLMDEKTQLPGYQQAPAKQEYQDQGKDLPVDLTWRKKKYPRKPGTKQVDRFDPKVQKGLNVLRRHENPSVYPGG